MSEYKAIDLPIIQDFNKPIFVENRHFRTKSTDEYFKAAYIEANSFPKVDGLIIGKELVDFIDCPVCKSKDKKELFVKWGFKISVCCNCEHVYVENQIKASVLSSLYTSSDVDEKFQERNEDKDLFKYSILLYNKYLQILKKKFDGKECLLDIGAGDGMFLEFLSAVSNFKLSAMEFSKKSEVFIKSIVGEVNFYNQAISKTSFNNKSFKIITLWGVVEHMSNPLEELSKCKSILDKDGRILILVPNFYSRALKIFGINTPTINPRSHLHYFSYNSFERLAQNSGFQIDEYYQELPVIDLMYDFIDYSDDLVESILKSNESYYSVYILRHQ